MKKTIRFNFLIAILILFLTGCILGNPFEGGGQGSLIVEHSKSGPEKASNRTRGLKGICIDDNSCVDICEDIYGDSDDEEESEGRVERCLKLSYSVVDSFEKIEKALDDPAYSKFQNIETRDFSDFLDVSLEPWIEYIGDMKKSESEVVLRWIASEKRVADAIISAHKNNEDQELYDGVAKLLSDLSPDYSDECKNTKEGKEEKACRELCVAIHNSTIGGGRPFSYFYGDKGSNNSSAKEISENLIEVVCGSKNCKYNANRCPGWVGLNLSLGDCTILPEEYGGGHCKAD